MAKLVRPHPHVADLNDRAFRAGVRITALLAKAGIHPSTWMRWRKGGGHTDDKLTDLELTLDQIIQADDDGTKA